MRLSTAVFVLLAPTLLACTTRDDDFMLLRRVETKDPGAPIRLVQAARNDGEALYIRQLLSNGFGAELLRTYAMTKRFAARTAGYHETPTTIVLGPCGYSEPEKKRLIDIGWWTTSMSSEQPIIWMYDPHESYGGGSPMGALVERFGDEILEVIAPDNTNDVDPPNLLRRGYLYFLETVAAEWRTPSLIDDRDELRRRRVFAEIRANEGVLNAHGDAKMMLRDPRVVGTVLSRMASSKLGQQMADPSVYLPFLEVKPPRDVHPALLLGAFRNFQAKLLSAWSRARAAGRPPHDVIDLVEAYADAYPAERAEATRIFLITTYGATVVADGVSPDAPYQQVESRLAMLNADVLFGRRRLRDGFAVADPAP
jgi:hypothetical protein